MPENWRDHERYDEFMKYWQSHGGGIATQSDLIEWLSGQGQPNEDDAFTNTTSDKPWTMSRSEILDEYDIENQYGGYIPEYDNTEEELKYYSDNDDEIESIFEAKQASLEKNKTLTENLYGNQMAQFNLQETNIEDTFDRKQEQALKGAANKFRQYSGKLQQQVSSGLGSNASILSKASQSDRLMDQFDTQMDTLGQQENFQLNKLGLQKDRATTQFESAMEGFDINKKQLGFGRKLGRLGLHEEYENKLYDRLLEIEKLQNR